MRSRAITLVALFLAVPSAARPDSVEPAPASDSRVNDVVMQRATLLADGLADAPRKERAVKTIQVVSVLVGGAAVGVMVPVALTADSHVRPYAAAIGGGAFALLGGGLLSYAVPDDYAFGVLSATSDITTGACDLAFGLIDVDTAPDRRAFPPALGYMLAAGEWGQAGLRVLDMSLRRPIAYGTLAADYRRLYSPRYRASMSAEDLAAVEARFERQGSLMSPFLLHAPVLAAGAAGVVYSLAAPNLSDLARGLGSAWSGLALISGLALAIDEQNTGFRLYQDQLQRTGLSVSVSPSPGGFSVSGRF